MELLVRGQSHWETVAEIAERPEARARVGVFADLPNLACAAEACSTPLEPSELLDAASAHGRVVVAVAYGVAYRGRRIQSGYANARAAGFRVVERVMVEERPKDIDTWMLADMLDALFSDRIDVLLIASGDSDFAPAAVIAHRLGKQVVVASFAGSLSASLVDEADSLLVLASPHAEPKGDRAQSDSLTAATNSGVRA